MKIYRLQTIGSIDGLKLCEEPTPEPRPGEVLVRIKATSLNFRDLTIVNGWSPFPLEEGRVQLSDAAGIVEAVGSGVTRFAIGDRVTNNFMPGWHAGPFREFATQYGTQADGWMAGWLNIAPLTKTSWSPFPIRSASRMQRRYPAPQSPPGIRSPVWGHRTAC